MSEFRIINGIKYIRIYQVTHSQDVKAWIKEDEAKVILKKKNG